jgi:hypothetical protein
MNSHFASRLRAPRASHRVCAARVHPRPERGLQFQLWLAEQAWGRILLHAWCLLFCHGRWVAAKSGIARGLRELGSQLARWFRKRK